MPVPWAQIPKSNDFLFCQVALSCPCCPRIDFVTPPVHAAQAARFPAEADTLSGMFEQRAAFTPDLPAIVTANEALSFGELDRMSRLVAGTLDRLPDPDRPVVLLMREGQSLFASILGAARAGRIFIPLEVTGAETWISRVITTSNAAFVIADEQAEDMARRAAGHGVGVLTVTEILESGAPPLHEVRARPQDVACVIYTSGSTGQPKGVVFGHDFMLHRIVARQRRYRFRLGCRFGHFRSSSYSAGLSNTLAALFSGAEVHILNLRAEGMHRLASWLNAHRITHAAFTSSLFRTWLSTLPESFRFPHIRVLSVAAEPVYGSDLARIGRHLSGDWCMIHSLSSTETGVVTSADFGPGSDLSAVLPAGAAIEGVEVTLEDEAGQPVPRGEIGEIVVRARYLAKGYWNDPENTRLRFAEEADGRRVYRTRDYGRFRPDGALEHLGRKDRKIKLRGYSVEPHEIECALLRLPGVRDAVVLVDGEGDEAKLCAFVSGPKDYSSRGGSDLRKALSKDLPQHLVPVRVVVLPSLPLTPRGKVDRSMLLKRLPRRHPERSRPPADEIERMLFDVWGKTLRRRDFGVDDSVHDLGATSLQIFSVFSWLDALGWNLSPSLILEAPTIAQQAEILRSRSPTCRQVGRLKPFREGGDRQPLFFAHARRGDILYARELSLLMRENRPVYGLRAPHLDGSEPLPRSVEDMAAAFIADVKRVQPTGPYNLCGYSFGGRLAFEMACQLCERGDVVSFLGLIDTQVEATKRYAPSGDIAPKGIRKLGAFLWSMGVAIFYWQDEIRMLLGKPVPPDRRLAYYNYIFLVASRRYRQKVYAGSAVIFASKDTGEAHQKGWSTVVHGELEVLEFPANHRCIIWPPINLSLAEAIDTRLEALEESAATVVTQEPKRVIHAI